MSAEVVELQFAGDRYAANFAKYDLASLVQAALEDVREEFVATVQANFSATLKRDFPKQWAAYCDSDLTAVFGTKLGFMGTP